MLKFFTLLMCATATFVMSTAAATTYDGVLSWWSGYDEDADTAITTTAQVQLTVTENADGTFALALSDNPVLKNFTVSRAAGDENVIIWFGNVNYGDYTDVPADLFVGLRDGYARFTLALAGVRNYGEREGLEVTFSSAGTALDSLDSKSNHPKVTYKDSWDIKYCEFFLDATEAPSLSDFTVGPWDSTNYPYTTNSAVLIDTESGWDVYAYSISEDRSNCYVTDIHFYKTTTLAQVTNMSWEDELEETYYDYNDEEWVQGDHITIADDLTVVAMYYDKEAEMNIVLLKDNAEMAYPYYKYTYKMMYGDLLGFNIQPYLIGAYSYFTDGQTEAVYNKRSQYSYDQGNWLEVEVNNDVYNKLKVKDIVAGGSIAGMIVDNRNLRIALDDDAVIATNGAAASAYTRNAYCPANFAAGDEERYLFQPSTDTDAMYLFLLPKFNELAQVVYAVYEGDGVFGFPSEEAGNSNNFKGTINNINFAYNSTTPEDLVVGMGYQFKAVVKYEYYDDTPNAAPGRKRDVRTNSTVSRNSKGFTIYPLDLDINDNRIVTGIDGVSEAREVASVKYYNLQGVEYSTMQPGMNIVVTTYSDGTRSTSKVVR